MQRSSRASRRENNRLVFERLWRGTFQAVLAGPQRRARASSHDPNQEAVAPAIMPQPSEPQIADGLEPALRTILAEIRNACCCRCNCSSNDRNLNDNLQVCLSDERERKSMRSVIRCAFTFYRLAYTPWLQYVSHATTCSIKTTSYHIFLIIEKLSYNIGLRIIIFYLFKYFCLITISFRSMLNYFTVSPVLAHLSAVQVIINYS